MAVAEPEVIFGTDSDAFAIWGARVRRLAYDRDAVLLAHNYQVPWIQDVADYVGDSLELSRRAAETDASVIVFCGVHFMAETAKLLCPEKLVLIPDLAAGCSLAATITADQLRRWKAEHPGAVVVSYVNTSAAVKAESDYCCTSANATAVVASVPEDREILFLPDMFLGAHVERVTGRTMHLWMGECHVHAGIEPADLDRRLAEHPDAELHVHPECGCSSQALWLASSGAIPPGRVHMLGTAGMQRRARETDAGTVVVATEVGLLHRLRAESPDIAFIPANPAAICRYMKLITPEKLERSLTEMVYEVDVPEDVARRARGALERMIEIG